MSELLFIGFFVLILGSIAWFDRCRTCNSLRTKERREVTPLSGKRERITYFRDCRNCGHCEEVRHYIETPESRKIEFDY